MSHSFQRPLPSAEDFELVQTRYVAVPALLWAAAVVVAIVTTIAQGGPAGPMEAASTAADLPAPTFGYGA